MEAEKNEKQIFIRNLSYDTTADDLTNLFQTFGPLKHASIVQDTSGVSKGYGFVKFALEADAASALEKLQGTALQGRKIKLELGVKKERVKKSKGGEGEEAPKTPVVAAAAPKSEPKAPKPARVATPKVAKAADGEEGGEAEDVEGSIKKSRQILVFGVPVDISKKAFKMALAKISKKSEVELVKEENELSAALHIVSPPGKIMMVTAISRQEAAKVVKALDNATVHQLQLMKYMGEAEDAAEKSHRREKLVARTLADLTEVEFRKRKCRLILRNLSFQAVEQNVIDRMSKFGPLVSVEIPRTIIEKNTVHRRRKHNEEEAESPDQIAANQTLRPKGFGFVTFLCERDAKACVEASAGLKVCNREVAIDFCMNKDSYTKYGQTGTEEEEQEGGQEKSEDAPEEKEEEEKDAEEGDEEDSEAEGGDDDDAAAAAEAEEEEEEDGEEEEDEEEEDDDEKKEDVQEGCTVFVRGLPFDAEASDVKAALKQFGRVVMSIVVKDKLTNISKGSAFVKFSSPAEADACLAEAGANSGLTIKDRVCKVNLAVDRDTAQKLKTEDRSGKDKRNLYLANEGLLLPKEGSKEGAKLDMSEADKEKRQRAQNEKRKKLVNPLFFVSGNRLSIRNLGKEVSDHELKVTCLKALKAGLARNLVTPADLENHIVAQGSATAVTKVIPKVDPKTAVKSAKVMLDLTRVRSGVPQSRGYGFVEFAHHAHALACLRELNNNGKYSDVATGFVRGEETSGGGRGKLIVEFSLENIQKVKILKERESRQKQFRENKAKEAASAAEVDTKEAEKPKKASKAEKSGKSAPAPAPAVEKSSGSKRKQREESTDEEVVVVEEEEEEVQNMKKPAKADKQDKPAKPAKEAKPVAPAAAPAAPAAPAKELSPEEAAKKAEKRERQKKRKLEFKATRKAEKDAERASKKARKSEGDSQPSSGGAGKGKNGQKGGKGGKKEGEPEKKAWGGHKRLRAMKAKAGGGAKK